MYKILKAEKLSENIFLMDVHAPILAGLWRLRIRACLHGDAALESAVCARICEGNEGGFS